MGEVYRALDTRLNRDVAVKILPARFAKDRQRMGRFQREAVVLAALDHPNIGTIFGIEDAGESKALILQLIEGPALDERIRAGAIPVEEALEIARQVAQGLEAAHEKGIIHRDLKPANVKISPQGQVKVLDFGLAKAAATDPEASLNLTQSPTLSIAATEAGLILGTASYMSPEQARGQAVDKRTDIWAFGCVLFEMLTGRKAFPGADLPEVLASIIGDPVDLSGLPTETPRAVVRMIRRCLEKDPRKRLRDIGDALLELDQDAQPAADTSPASEVGPRLWSQWLPWGLLAISVLAIIVLWQGSSQLPSPRQVQQFEIELPRILPTGTDLALSPEGRHLAYVGVTEMGRTALFIRSSIDGEVWELPGTERASQPFFSPDGKWVGFLGGQGQILKTLVEGGPPRVIAQASDAYGISWGEGDVFVYGSLTNGLFQRTASEDSPSRLTATDQEGEAHVSPHILPDGETVLFTVWRGDNEDAEIGIVSLKRPLEWKTLGHGTQPQIASGDRLLFARQTVLMGASLDLREWKLLGEPVPLIEDMDPGIVGRAKFEISKSGDLFYLPTGDAFTHSRLVWVDRDGNEEPALPDQDFGYLQPAISPGGDRLAFGLNRPGEPGRLWTLNFQDGRRLPLIVNHLSVWPVWSPNGEEIAFISNQGGSFNTFTVPADGGGAPKQWTFESEIQGPTSWSIKDVLAIEQGPTGQRDIYVLPMDGQSELEPFLVGEFHERGGRFSPNGNWLAYTSNRSGQDEVWLTSYPSRQPPIPISIGGGREPVWSRDGDEIFYRIEDRMMAVPIQTKPNLRVGRPELLFRGDYTYGYLDWSLNFDVTSEDRFLMVREGPASRLHVIVNWIHELEPLIPES